MKKIACRYAIIRFMPYRETEEFANVGIVLASPATGYFDFKLLTRRYGHITSFFDELDSHTYSSAIKLFAGELARIKSLTESDQRQSPEELRSLFDALVQPREAIMRFSELRPRLADAPREALEQLFKHYVERDFVTPEYKEYVVLKRVKQLVNSLKLDNPFRAMHLGDEFASAQFPLVQAEAGGVARKVIKPFFLDQDEPSKIINHGGAWVDRVKRLRNRKLLPNDVLFAVDGPSQSAGNRYIAFREICDDLSAFDIAVIRTQEERKIIEFATA